MTFPSIISSKQSLITIMLSVICWCKKCKCDIFAVFLPLLEWKIGKIQFLARCNLYVKTCF